MRALRERIGQILARLHGHCVTCATCGAADFWTEFVAAIDWSGMSTCGGRYTPPLAMVETIVTSCSGVTATSWPMAMEPMDEGCQRLTGRSRPRVSPGSSTSGARAEAEVANVLIELVGADLERELDGGHVAGLLQRLVHRNHAVVFALVVVNDAAGRS